MRLPLRSVTSSWAGSSMRSRRLSTPLGFHTRRKIKPAPRETMQATTLVSWYAKKVAAAHWAMAKEMPITAAAGPASLTPRMPSRMKRMKKGTTAAMSRTCREISPAISAVCSAVRPPTEPAVVTGMPTAPKATGAVLAISTVVAALSGFTPRARIMVAVIATGAPKPARASNKPPKQKAMRMAWMRISPSPSRSKVLRRSSKRPEATVTS